MKHFTEHLWFQTDKRRELVNITGRIEELIEKSGIQEGLCLVNASILRPVSSLTTPNRVCGRISTIGWRNRRPHEPLSNYRHNLTGEDNGDAHLKRTIMGRETVVAVTGGRLDLGPCEQIFYGNQKSSRRSISPTASRPSSQGAAPSF